MDDNVKQRIETIKSILRSISSNYGEDVDFMFTTIDLKNNHNIDYIYDVKHEQSPQDFHMISEISKQDFHTQQRYRFEAETGRGQIVQCLNNEFIHPDAFQLLKDKLYKIAEVMKVEGETYYKLEYIENGKIEDFVGYEATRFCRLLSSNSVN